MCEIIKGDRDCEYLLSLTIVLTNNKKGAFWRILWENHFPVASHWQYVMDADIWFSMFTVVPDSKKNMAKNTLALYFRMLFTMFVSLYTSRVVLNALGVSDFGVYNVVGGMVAIFSFLNGTMSAATQRFLSYAIGKGDNEQLMKIFNMTIFIHICICLLYTSDAADD